MSIMEQGDKGFIEINNVSRIYNVPKKINASGKITAVNDVSFKIQKGEIFGMLGPNGAGKSTIIKMMTTVLLPTKGTISLMGLDSFKKRGQIRNHINVVFGGERGMYWKLSGYENLLYFSHLYQIPKKIGVERINNLLEEFNLTQFKDLPVTKYSSGMKQKLHFVRALLNDPEIIFLDEPTNALDPATAVQVRQVILKLKKQGKTIVLATHNMLEADRLCDRLIIMNKGEIIEQGRPDELKRFLQTGKVTIKIRGLWSKESFIKVGLPLNNIVVKHVANNSIVQIIGLSISVNEIICKVMDLKAEIISVSEDIPELEEVYIKSVSKEADR